MQKLVKPAIPLAKIPDPTYGEDLPPEGRIVEWSPYWQRLQDLGDEIIVEDAEGVTETTPPPEDQPPAPETPARRSRYAPTPPAKTRDGDQAETPENPSTD